MHEELLRNGADVRIRCDVERILVEHGRVTGVVVNGRTIGTGAVISNANLKSTVFDLVGERNFDRSFAGSACAVRLNNSSTQVYMALKPEEQIEESTGDLLFSSTAQEFRTDLLLSRDITSRTFSFYYPRTRPQGRPRCAVVSSTNARYEDWAGLSEEEYEASKADLIETTLDALEKYVPNCRERISHVEAATPVTFRDYTKHVAGASFGTKFEGLAVSRGLPEQVRGLYHAGSVGIIMSGWLGAMNYGVIVANDVDALLAQGTPATDRP
jgi:phytoene dehydrogenase-like protein